MSSFFDPLWVVASYYNPVGYKRRLQISGPFAGVSNAPLMVVELARAGSHELSKDDADIVLSLTGEDRIWQKERLLNIGIGELPRHVEYVAWVDCDVIFDDEGWLKRRQRGWMKNAVCFNYSASQFICRETLMRRPFRGGSAERPRHSSPTSPYPTRSGFVV